MVRLTRRLAAAGGTLAVALLLMVPANPAKAQWIGAGRWGTESSWRHVVPGTWLVHRQDSTTQPVSIHAEGDNHVGRIALWCNPETQDSALRFEAYRGDALRQPPAVEQMKVFEPVVFDIDGQRFERVFEYDAERRIWTASSVLDAAFLDAFSWGSRMELLNSTGQRITAYNLNGSGGARQALRAPCQF